MPNPYLMDESKIPDNWTPTDSVAVRPGQAPLAAGAAPIPNEMPQFFSGSMPPVLQHDVSFVGTEVASPRIPKTALMPLGNQANPFTNAAASSTATTITNTIINNLPAPPASGGLSARATAAISSGSIANNATATGSVSMAKTFSIIFVTVNHACRVQLYSTAAGRDTVPEPTRPISVPPTPGLADQIIADWNLTGLTGVPLTFPCQPPVLGANQDGSESTTIYWRVTNLSGSTTTITASITYLQLEA
jgi:hypothetical protein